MRVVVKNNGPAWSARFNGETYDFAAGEEVTIPEVAAMFFFAFGMSDVDRGRVLVRNGWQKNGIKDDPFGPDAAKKRLMSFSFRTVPDVERVKPKAKVLKPAFITKPDEASEPQDTTIQLPGKKGPPAPAAAA